MAAPHLRSENERATPESAVLGRLACSKREAADALGVSVDFLEQHVMHELRVVRRGRRRLIPVRELERWLDRNAARVLDAERPIEPKSRAGRRFVPMSNILRRYLEEHRAACPWRDGLVFGTAPDKPFWPKTVAKRARLAWREAGLTPITLHECRHTVASLMIAAGVNAHAIKTYMGHSTIAFTFDRYGHLMPGNGAEAAQLLDAYVS